MTKHTHASIRPTKERTEDDLLSRPGVTGVDIGVKKKGGKETGELAIVVYVKKKKPKTALKPQEVVPPEIDGVPTDVVEEEIVLQARAAALVTTPLVDGAPYSTLQGGISMGPCRSVYLAPPDVPVAGNYVFVGTLGALVKDRATGAVMALTNFHVACVDSGWAVGNTMTQPSRVDAGSCPTGTFGTLVRAVLSTHVDGAVVSIDQGKATSCEIAEIGNVKGKTAATINMAVRKRGRTTGLTYGTVTSLDYTTSVDYGDGLGTHVLKNQLRITVDTAHSTQFGDHGDSGSVVVDASNKVVGLHFAGNTAGTIGIANPIDFVLDELNVDLCVPHTRLLTSPVLCDPILSKPVICYVLTKPAICAVVTKPNLCALLTKPSLCVVTNACPIVTSACPPVSLACGPGRPGPGDPGPFTGAEGDPTAAYGTTSAEECYWLGYYTALEAAAEAEAIANSGI